MIKMTPHVLTGTIEKGMLSRLLFVSGGLDLKANKAYSIPILGSP